MDILIDINSGKKDTLIPSLREELQVFIIGSKVC